MQGYFDAGTRSWRKRQNFRKFENKVFSQGVAEYFEQISTACEVLFAFIDEAVKAAHKNYTVEMPDSAEIISGLIDELVENDKASTRQMIETEKAQLQREAESGKFARPATNNYELIVDAIWDTGLELDVKEALSGEYFWVFDQILASRTS